MAGGVRHACDGEQDPGCGVRTGVPDTSSPIQHRNFSRDLGCSPYRGAAPHLRRGWQQRSANMHRSSSAWNSAKARSTAVDTVIPGACCPAAGSTHSPLDAMAPTTHLTV